ADDQCVDVVVVIEMLDHQLEADQRFSIPGIGGRMVDGDQRGVAVLLDGQLVGQVEDAGFVGFDGSTHGLDPRKLVRGSAAGCNSPLLPFRVHRGAVVAAEWRDSLAGRGPCQAVAEGTAIVAAGWPNAVLPAIRPAWGRPARRPGGGRFRSSPV